MLMSTTNKFLNSNFSILFSIFFIFFFSNNKLFAKMNIQQIDLAKETALVSFTDEKVSKKNTLLINLSENQQCSSYIIEVKDSSAIIDISSCPLKTKIKKGQSVEISQMDIKKEQISSGNVTPTRPQLSSTYLKSKNESWYLYVGLGFSSIKYSSNMLEATNDLKDNYGLNTKLNIDLFGVYWPILQHKMMLGFVFHSISDSYDDIYDQNFSFTQNSLNFTAMYFFGANIGDGVFLRGDLGTTNGTFSFRTDDLGYSRDTIRGGYCVLFGGGYSFVINNETRMPIGFYISRTTWPQEEIEVINNYSLTLGFIF